MQLRKTLLVGLLSATMLSGCSWFSGETDTVVMAPLPQVENQFTPQTVWRRSVGNGVGDFYSHLRPAYQDNHIYAADRQGLVMAMNAENGDKLWSVNLGEKDGWFSRSDALLSGGLTVAGSKLYVGSEHALVYALNSDDGSVAWKTTVAGEAISRPVVSDGLVLIHTSNGMLQALDENDGAIKWTVSLDMPSLTLRGESAPAVAYGAAIVGGDNGRVSAVLLQQGQMIWQQRVAQPTGATEIDRLNDIDMTPVVVDGVVYALGYNGSLSALDLRSGQIVWKRDMGGVNNIIVDGGRIYLVDQDGRVAALGINGGVVLWKNSELLHRGVTAPVLYRGYLVVGDAEGYLYWINPDDGRLVVEQKLDSSGLLSAGQVAGDNLIIQARGGDVYAISR